MATCPASLQAPMRALKVDVLGLRPPPHDRIVANSWRAAGQSPYGLRVRFVVV
jgi:hypothetical protein